MTAPYRRKCLIIARDSDPMSAHMFCEAVASSELEMSKRIDEAMYMRVADKCGIDIIWLNGAGKYAKNQRPQKYGKPLQAEKKAVKKKSAKKKAVKKKSAK